jgi:hypothetical protein
MEARGLEYAYLLKWRRGGGMGVSNKSRNQEATERLGEESPSRMELLCTSRRHALAPAVFDLISSVGTSSISCRLYTV